ncbi:MAG: hypothetical protein IPG39_15485 [Bacteroidetes bacterium]|nr:hypothetical protein [Bacteroidota bacterium]
MVKMFFIIDIQLVARLIIFVHNSFAGSTNETEENYLCNYPMNTPPLLVPGSKIGIVAPARK